MGFKKDILNNVRELQNKLDILMPKETIELAAKIEAREAAIDAQVADGAQYTKFKLNYDVWLIINQWANYMANVFRYETQDDRHMAFLLRAIRYAFIFGVVHVWNNNGTPEIVSVMRRDKQWKVYVINEADDTVEKTEGWMKYKEDFATIKVNPDDIITYKFESLGFSAYLTLGPIITTEQLAQKALYNDMLMLPTRLIQKSEAPDPKNKAAKQIIEFNSPILFSYMNGTDKFEGLTIDVFSSDLLAVIEYTKNYYYDLMGRRTNSDFKRAHALEAEIRAGQDNFKILERDRYINLKLFLRAYARKFGIVIYLENSLGELTNVFDLDKTKEDVNEIIRSARKHMNSGSGQL